MLSKSCPVPDPSFAREVGVELSSIIAALPLCTTCATLFGHVVIRIGLGVHTVTNVDSVMQ